MHSRRVVASVVLASSLSTLVACAASSRVPSDSDFNDGGTSPDGGPLGVSPGPLPGSFGDAATPDGGLPTTGGTRLYAHTDTELFELDPADLGSSLKSIGHFDCIGTGTNIAKSMTDVAVSKDGKLFAVSEIAAYPLTIGGGKVHCDAIWALPASSQFYGLTVAPEGTVDAAEVLVAANGLGELFRIDATTGNTTQVGTFGKDTKTGLPWELSGDIVFVANGGNPIGYATVRTCPPRGTCDAVDTLIEIDVRAVKPGKQSVLKAVRGRVQKGVACPNGPATFGSIYGIAAYADKVYGFSRQGDIVDIQVSDGSACLVKSFPLQKFAGAGVTTSVAVVAAPPK